MKVLAAACVAVAAVSALTLSSMKNQDWGGLWWVAVGALALACLAAAAWLVRKAERSENGPRG